MTIAQTLGQRLARSKALLRRDDTNRGLEELLGCLEEYEPKKMPAKIRFETEVQIQECVSYINRQPSVRTFLQQLAKNNKPIQVPYKPGEEQKLKMLLGLVHKGLIETEAAGEKSAAQARAERKIGLETKALAALKAGDSPRGKATLRILGEEFGEEPGLLAKIGGIMLEYKLYFEAAEILEQAMEAFPKDGKAYGLAAQCYLHMREFEKAETVYLNAMTRFGKHPRTLLNLAKLYATWNQREKAFQTAMDAYNKDPSLAEAKEIMDKFE